MDEEVTATADLQSQTFLGGMDRRNMPGCRQEVYKGPTPHTSNGVQLHLG